MVGKVDHKEDPSTRNVCFRFGNVDTKLAITDAQLKRSKAENVMREDILRLYVKQRGSKIVSEAEELEECIEHVIEGVEEAILKGK